MTADDLTPDMLTDLRQRGVRSIRIIGGSEPRTEVDFYQITEAELAARSYTEEIRQFYSMPEDERAKELRKREESLLYGSS